MKITVIGSGYVGLVTGTCFAEFGFYVTCVDNNQQKIAQLNQDIIPIYEPGLDVMVAHNLARGRLAFTTAIQESVREADVVFIAVGTPSRRGEGHADLSYVYSAAEEIAAALEGYTVIVTKSTVPVGTGRKVKQIIRQKRPQAEFDVVSNPEFLREGSAIEDFMKPDRVVIGSEAERATAVMQELYRPLSSLETPIVFTTLETAELTKYASNAFLSTKIAFINEIADLCERCGADIQGVAKGMGLDKRIGERFLNAGPGYGGSCFPKDTLALMHTANDYGTRVSIVDAAVTSNKARKQSMTKKVIGACGGDVRGKTLCVLGVTFKPDTDDMRDAPSLDIVPSLIKAGAKIRAFDPQGQKEGRDMLPPEVEWFEDPYMAMKEADAVVIITEWNEFRALDFNQMKLLLKKPLMIDLRNIYVPSQVQEKGFDYVSIGRSPAHGFSRSKAPILRVVS
ncbi:MAG: UDP-glucose/GDP-mannose dehydrogenase family protein [Caedimonas sp.]|nr:UDP-glucose/GDP-mannose dehydrogenase family protein [Caedimonas sp.]